MTEPTPIEAQHCANLRRLADLVINPEYRNACEWALRRLDDLAKLKATAGKVVLCFPDEIAEGAEMVGFNIPAYVIDELRKAAK